MSTFENFFRLSITSLLRDRLLYLLLSLAFLVLLLIPLFSMFSLRQVQELSVTLSLSALSLLLLVVAVLTGASSLWRDVEKRYTASVLGLPVSRGALVVGKFLAIATLLAAIAALFGLGSVLAIKVAAASYPADIPVRWDVFAAAVCFEYLKNVMLLSLAFLFSAVSTSFYFPFLASFAIYLAGSASQDVFEMLSGSYGQALLPSSRALIKGIYYLLPNFSAFDLKTQAIYALPLSPGTLVLTCIYFVCYTGLALSVAVWSFSRRELA
ncbi:ABC transporter permease [Geomonas sp. RF6]|uniref:ABC transporter permease subunit n=1 Tax=Geomonas sp. RF6 TaxID=2897342 RepID=UPI001E312781|nr:ABC transporter permease subunit [Geomonas sp. RF6]UFS69712.1 ABC transporter permease [Geomonas sp. RF6]